MNAPTNKKLALNNSTGEASLIIAITSALRIHNATNNSANAHNAAIRSPIVSNRGKVQVSSGTRGARGRAGTPTIRD